MEASRCLPYWATLDAFAAIMTMASILLPKCHVLAQTNLEPMQTMTMAPLRAEIASQLACPIEWECICGDCVLRDYLLLLWRCVAIEHQVDREGTLALSKYDFPCSNGAMSSALSMEDDRSLRPALCNILTWIDSAKEAYRKLVPNIAGLVVAGKDIYSKHYPKLSLSRSQIVEKSKSTDSLLFHEYSVEVQTQILWDLLGTALETAYGDLWDDELQNFRREIGGLLSANFRFFAQSCHEVGASNGMASKCFCFEIDFPSRIAHMYPVPCSAYDTAGGTCGKIAARVFLDDLPLQIVSSPPGYARP